MGGGRNLFPASASLGRAGVSVRDELGVETCMRTAPHPFASSNAPHTRWVAVFFGRPRPSDPLSATQPASFFNRRIRTHIAGPL